MKQLLIFALVIILSATAFSQSSSTLYLYREIDLSGKNKTIAIYVDNELVCDLQSKSKLKYVFNTEGTKKLTAKCEGTEENYTMNVQFGTNYFVKVDWKMKEMGSIKFKLKLGSEGSNEYSRIPDSKEFVVLEKNKEKTETVSTETNIKTNTASNIQKPSDVDLNLPTNSFNNELCFALIIGNEDYTKFQPDLKSEVNVEYARNDAQIFKEYVVKTLNVPEKNVSLLLDATSGQMNQALSKINLLAKNTGGKAKLIFYYAGHGLPDENTKEPYLIPADVNGSNLSSAIKLTDVYKKLSEFPCERITVFLDACFSGGARNQGLVAARGVKIKPKEEIIKGNMIVFTSSSGEQSSMPYKDKQHGLFSYYLLKKLQESKGNVSYKELSDFLKEKVSLESLLINNKEQNPSVLISTEIAKSWEQWKISQE